MTMTLIETVTLTSAASSIEFTSIPQDGTDLLLVISARRTEADTTLKIELNGDAVSGNYTGRKLSGNGSAAFSSTSTDAVQVRSTDTANTFGSTTYYISNYAGSQEKSLSVDSVTENNATEAFQLLVALKWADTSAVTSVELLANFASGSTASLYKIS